MVLCGPRDRKHVEFYVMLGFNNVSVHGLVYFFKNNQRVIKNILLDLFRNKREPNLVVGV